MGCETVATNGNQSSLSDVQYCKDSASGITNHLQDDLKDGPHTQDTGGHQSSTLNEKGRAVSGINSTEGCDRRVEASSSPETRSKHHQLRSESVSSNHHRTYKRQHRVESPPKGYDRHSSYEPGESGFIPELGSIQTENGKASRHQCENSDPSSVVQIPGGSTLQQCPVNKNPFRRKKNPWSILVDSKDGSVKCDEKVGDSSPVSVDLCVNDNQNSHTEACEQDDKEQLQSVESKPSALQNKTPSPRNSPDPSQKKKPSPPTARSSPNPPQKKRPSPFQKRQPQQPPHPLLLLLRQKKQEEEELLKQKGQQSSATADSTTEAPLSSSSWKGDAPSTVLPGPQEDVPPV